MSPSLRQARNYYAWIASEFEDVLGRRVLDIGGGDGPLLEHVLDDAREVTSVDLSMECVAAMQERYRGHPFRGIVGDVTDAKLVASLATEAFDTIVCVNVLEHIEDDARALRHMAQILGPGAGRLFLLVPAHPALYGTPDVLAGHYRRYSRRMLRERFSAAGFRIERLRHFNNAGALPYFINSRIFRPQSLGGGVDRQLVLFDRWVVPVARRVERWARLPFGQSLVAVANMGERA